MRIKLSIEGIYQFKITIIFYRYNVETSKESDLHLSDLLIENVTLKDNGTYECKASNTIGNGDQSGTPVLLVQGNFNCCFFF